MSVKTVVGLIAKKSVNHLLTHNNVYKISTFAQIVSNAIRQVTLRYEQSHGTLQ